MPPTKNTWPNNLELDKNGESTNNIAVQKKAQMLILFGNIKARLWD